MSGNFTRGGMGRRVSYGTLTVLPPSPAADAEFEAAQPITRDDRRAMLRNRFAAGGMSLAEIDAALRKTKV